MISRRRFLAASAVAASVIGLPAIVRSASPNSRLALAFIGCGGRGGANLNELVGKGEHDNVVALCDVNLRNLEQAASRFPSARKYRDFRKLYEEPGDIDAVVVSTTEHTHAFATLPALAMRKHVYCEKPLTHNVEEAIASSRRPNRPASPRRWAPRSTACPTIAASSN